MQKACNLWIAGKPDTHAARRVEVTDVAMDSNMLNSFNCYDKDSQSTRLQEQEA